jgi:hypothetical protein
MAEASRREFDWDDANLRHLARHRISRLEFEQAITHRPITGWDASNVMRESYFKAKHGEA